MKKYQIRNVSDREIYDSYMGILRISPNQMSPSNDKLVDDPTSHLNSILSVDVLNKKQTQMEIQLSDSDGNELPIAFVPKARTTYMGSYSSNSTSSSLYLPIINIVTKIKEEASLYISNTFKSYSTIYLDNTEDTLGENDLNDYLNDIRLSPLQILSKSGNYENLILYPVESPHDSDYFNNKNYLNLVDYSRTDRIKNREETLLSKSHDWYEENIPTNLDENGFEKSERVRVGDFYEEYYDADGNKKLKKSGGRYVTTYNNDGETIPVLYTRDYVMGHYDGHNVKINNGIIDKWIGSKSSIRDRENIDQVTKLSWLRFDDLVWDVVDNALRGELRHTKGRYKKLGENEGDNVIDALFTGGTSALCDDASLSEGDILLKTSPLVAQGVQPGLIVYNAMSFQRYMFHVTRQMCCNMDYQFNKYVFDDKNVAISKGDDWNINIKEDEKTWADFNILGRLIKRYKNQGLITPAPQGALSGAQNLSKNFAFCDGREITYANYPNLNLSNDKIFDLKGFLPKNYTKKEDSKIEDKDFVISEKSWEVVENDNYQIYNFIKKTPELYSLYDSSPRFLRALNWDVGETYNTAKAVRTEDNRYECVNDDEPVVDFGSDKTYTTYLSNNKTIININNTQITSNEDGDIIDERTSGEEQSNVVKDINSVGLYFQNNDSMVRKNDHYHASFSAQSGMNSVTDVKGEVENTTPCVDYRSGKKRGAKVYCCDHKTILNHDFTYSVAGDNSKNWIDYCFNKKNINKYNGYAPIPNAGLFLFNKQLYNPIDGQSLEYIGTKKEVEQEIENGNYVYYDGENKEHKILPIRSPRKLSELFFEKINQDETLKKLNIQNIEDILFKYVVTETNKRPRVIVEPFLDYKKIESIIHKRCEEVNDAEVLSVPKCKDAMREIFKEVFESHVQEKEIRRYQMIKMNESEGRIPASSVGGPLYSSWVIWSRRERRNIKKMRRKDYSFRWKSVGHYKIGSNNNADKIRGEVENASTNMKYADDYKYRCLTSIPYQNSSKLGVGDPTKDVKEDFYSKNSITTPQSDMVYEDVTYGEVDITKDGDNTIGKILRDAPTPSYVNLLPLIRI